MRDGITRVTNCFAFEARGCSGTYESRKKKPSERDKQQLARAANNIKERLKRYEADKSAASKRPSAPSRQVYRCQGVGDDDGIKVEAKDKKAGVTAYLTDRDSDQAAFNWTVLEQPNPQGNADPWILSQNLLLKMGWLVVEPCTGPAMLIDRDNFGHALDRSESGLLYLRGHMSRRGVFVTGDPPRGAALPPLAVLIDNASTMNVASSRWNDYLDVGSGPGPAASVAGCMVVESIGKGVMSVVLSRKGKKQWSAQEVGEMLFDSRNINSSTLPLELGTVYRLTNGSDSVVAAVALQDTDVLTFGNKTPTVSTVPTGSKGFKISVWNRNTTNTVIDLQTVVTVIDLRMPYQRQLLWLQDERDWE